MSRFIDLIQPFNGVRFTRGGKTSSSISIGIGSVHAFLVLNGTMSTDANGNSFLVNSKNMTDIEKRIAEFESMKWDIFWRKQFNTPFSNCGNTYYVSTDGDNNNDGLSELTPWKSIDVALMGDTPVVAGDAVLFKRGQTFSYASSYGENVTPNFNGTEDNAITIGAYGSFAVDGALPIINVLANYVTTWTQPDATNEPNIWVSSTAAGQCPRLWENGVEIKPNINLEDGTYPYPLPVGGTRWHADGSGHILLYSETDPNANTYERVIPYRALKLDNNSYINFQDLDFQGGSTSCIEIVASNNINFNNCIVGKAIGGISVQLGCDNINIFNSIVDSKFSFDYNFVDSSSGLSDGGIPSGDGIFYGNGATNSTVSKVYIKNFGHASISSNVTNGDLSLECFNNKFEWVYGTAPSLSYGGRLGFSGADERLHNCTFDYIYLKDTSVRSQIGGHHNTITNVVIDGVKNSNFKSSTVGQGMALQDYNGKCHDNLLKDITIMNTDSYGFWNTSIADNIYNNIMENINIINCGLKASESYISLRTSTEENISGNIYRNINIDNKLTTLSVFDRVTNTYISVDAFNQASYTDGVTSNEYLDSGISIFTGGRTKFIETALNYISLGTKVIESQRVTYKFKYKSNYVGAADYILYFSSNPIFWTMGGMFRVYINGVNYDIDLDFSKEIDFHISIDNGYLEVFADNQPVLMTNVGQINTTSSVFISGNAESTAMNGEIRDVLVINGRLPFNPHFNSENLFRHFNINDNYVDNDIDIPKENAVLNIPLNEVGATKHDYATNTDYTVTNYTTDCDVQGLSTGLQKIAFDDSMIYTAEQMNFYNGDAPQYVQDLVVGQPLSIKETMKNGVVYVWTYEGTTQKLYKDGVEQTNATITEVNIGEISRLNGELESEIDTYELFNKVIKI